MASVAFSLPITPGKTEEWKRWGDEMLGLRRSEYMASRKRLGVTIERVYHQQTPTGDMAIIYIEAADIPSMFQAIAVSQDPFDVWFRKRAKDFFSGFDLSAPPPHPPPMLVFDGVVDRD